MQLIITQTTGLNALRRRNLLLFCSFVLRDMHYSFYTCNPSYCTLSSLIQEHQYFQKLQDLDTCGNAITKELSSRKDYIESEGKSEEALNQAYDITDKALYKIAPGATKQEWRISEKIHQHRHNIMKAINVITDGIFYSDFIHEVLNFGISDVKRIEELSMWKRNYDYIKLTKQIFSVKPMLVVINFTCPLLVLRSSGHSSVDMVSFLQHAEQSLNKMKLNDSSETSEFLRTSEKIFGNLSETIHSPVVNMEFIGLQDHSEIICNETMLRLSELLSYKLRRREILFKTLTELNSASIRRSILIFCSILISMLLTVVCAAMFGYLLRYECRVSIGVSDWLENVMNEVKEHELNRELVLKRVSILCTAALI